MKKTRAAALILLLAKTASAGEAGVLEDLQRPVSARLTALGGAATGLADDWAFSRVNPAGLGRLWRQETVMSRETLFSEQTTTTLGYAYPTLRAGTFAAGVHHVDYGDFQGYDADANRTGTLKADAWDLDLGYGRSLGAGWSAGAALRNARQTLAGRSAAMTVVDGGVLYQALPKTAFPAWSAGAAVRGLGHVTGGDAATVREGSLGFSLRPLFDALIFSADWVRPGAGKPFPRAGVEYKAREVVALRAGWDGRADAGSGLSVGAGVDAWGLQIDYAFQPYGDLGDRQQVTLTYRFGSLAEAYYERGMEYLRRGDDARAILQFTQVIRLDPFHRRALMRIKEANERLQKNQRSLQWP